MRCDPACFLQIAAGVKGIVRLEAGRDNDVGCARYLPTPGLKTRVRARPNDYHYQGDNHDDNDVDNVCS